MFFVSNYIRYQNCIFIFNSHLNGLLGFNLSLCVGMHKSASIIVMFICLAFSIAGLFKMDQLTFLMVSFLGSWLYTDQNLQTLRRITQFVKVYWKLNPIQEMEMGLKTPTVEDLERRKMLAIKAVEDRLREKGFN